MSKAIIYKDEKSEMIFCENGNIYVKNGFGGYMEVNQIISRLPKSMKEKSDMLKVYKTLGYKKASKLHLRNNKAKGRQGSLSEGVFNE